MPTFFPMVYRMTRYYIILLLVFVFSVPLCALATETEKKDTPSARAEKEWSAPIRFYQKTISRADGNRCSMHPSCSRYALDAFKKHTFFMAWLLTSDRLLRCGHDELHLSPRVRDRGKLKAYDPLSANTFWWEKP